MFVDATHLPFCVRFRTETILTSKIRYFDVLILLANVIFLLLIVVKWFRARSKLNPSKPLLFSVTCLIVAITLANIFRCVFAMIFPIQAFPAQELILKILWLLVRLTLLCTELSVLLFGICFGRVNPNYQSIKTIKILLISFVLACLYITLEAVLEIRGDARPIQLTAGKYNLYSYGGMKFLLGSSSIFLLMYMTICFLPCICRRHRKYLPARRSFYLYCFVLALINMVQVIGTILNITGATINSVCIVDGTTCIFYIFFAPFVYHQFLRRALSSQTMIPQIMYADTSLNADDDLDDGDDDDANDDELIDPGLKPLIDLGTNENLDGQFDDITASTRILHPVL